MSSNLIVNNIEVGAGATIYTAASNTLTFGTNGSEKVRITSEGKVGINTTTPTRQLEVFDATQGTIAIKSGDAGQSSLWLSDSDINIGGIYYEHSNNALGIRVNDNERLRINSSGKTILHGGGATNANNTATILENGNTLNIHGTSSSDGISVVRYSADYGAYGINIGKSRNSTFGTNTLVNDGNELGHISFYGADGTDFEMAAQITGLVDGSPATGGDGTDMPGALSFRTTPEGSDSVIERLRIKSDGDVIIGGTDAGYPNFADNLTIHDTQHSGITIRSGIASQGAVYFSDATGSGAGTYVGNIIYDHSDNHMRFATSGNERLRIKSDGNITTDYNIKSNNLPGRNLIINGDFQIAQRATTNNTAGAQSTYHTLDRWMTQIQSGTITESQQSLTSSDTGPWEKGFRYYMRLLNQSGIGGGAAQYAEMDQLVEAQNIAQSGWNYNSSSSYITLSFWIRASVAQDYTVVMYTDDSTTRHYPFTVTLSANTWTKVEKAIPGYSGITINNDNGRGVRLTFIAAYGTNYTSNSGTLNSWNTTGNGLNRFPDVPTTWATTTNATFDLTGVQLEVGSIATEFEHRSYAEELALCQRYYYMVAKGASKALGLGVNYTASEMHLDITFPVTMRTTPTLDAASGTNYYEFIRNGAADWFNSFNLGNRTTNKIGELYNNSEISGSGLVGYGGFVRTDNSAVHVGFDCEL